ncbi:hypothetical protein HDU98_001794, partial [Podochytrium sp. JEL0797]
MSSPAVNALEVVSIAFAAITFCELISCLYFIFRVEATGKATKLTAVFSPFSTHLLIMMISATAVHAAELRFLFSMVDHIQISIAMTIRASATAMYEYSYIRYSYLRASNIMDGIFPIVGRNCYGFKWVGVMYMLQAIVSAASIWANQVFPHIPNVAIIATKIATYIKGLNLIILAGTDIICLTTFVKFLHKTRSDAKSNIDGQFVIISRYGIVASVTLL